MLPRSCMSVVTILVVSPELPTPPALMLLERLPGEGGWFASGQEGTFSMASPHSPDGLVVRFDDDHAVANQELPAVGGEGLSGTG